MNQLGRALKEALARHGPSTPGGGASEREGRVAAATCAGLYIVGATLIVTSVLLPHVSAPAVIAIGLTGYATAALLLGACVRDSNTLTLAWIGDLWGILLVALLCAATGGATSPFALVYFFAIGHAAAFQSRRRVGAVLIASLLAILMPLAYGHVASTYWAVVAIGIVLGLLGTALVHSALARMRDQRWRLEFLTAASANLDTSLDPEQTLHKIARTAVPDLAELCVIDLIDADGTITSTVAEAADAPLAAAMARLRTEQPLGIRGSHPVARALRAREPFVIDGLQQSVALQRAAAGGNDAQARLLRDAGVRAAAVLPMIARGRMLGAISFVRVGGPDARYQPDHLALLEDLTGRASLAYDNARLYAERAHVAHTLRRSLMPERLPGVPGLELASYFQPMGAGSEVGGDFYDVFVDRADCWLIVGDVCGKGAEAAVLTGFLRHTTLAYTREGAAPWEVLTRVNEAMLTHDFDGRFATAILARLQLGEPEVPLTLAAAGHPPALIVRAAGRGAEQFGECGTLLGVFDDPAIGECQTTLRSGDALTLYTDGLSEAHAPERVLTVEDMLAALARSEPRFAREAIETLIALGDLGKAPRDDVAVLAARVQHPASA